MNAKAVTLHHGLRTLTQRKEEPMHRAKPTLGAQSALTLMNPAIRAWSAPEAEQAKAQAIPSKWGRAGT